MATVNTESAPSSQVSLRDCESGRSDTSLTCGFNTHERADPEGAFMEPGPHLLLSERKRVYAPALKCQEGVSRASHEQRLRPCQSG